jgi:thymidylate synthase
MFDHATIACESLADAIPRVLSVVREEGLPVLVRGEVNREVLGVDIAIADPADRIPQVSGRRLITPFCLAEFLWYCGQRTDLASLKPYAPNISNYYSGVNFTTGSNYGGQIFGGRHGGSQWAKVVELLHADPGSKRAFIGLFAADDVTTLLPANPDVSCTIGFQAFVRQDRLHWVTSMRANDAYRGFVSDVFSFTMFHELLASTLNVPLGQYLHRPTSLHTFPEDEEAIGEILALSGRTADGRQPRTERMPPLDHRAFWPGLLKFWDVHERCHQADDWTPLIGMRNFTPDPWWTWAVDTLSSFHERRDR